jgi:hypothetical protein
MGHHIRWRGLSCFGHLGFLMRYGRSAFYVMGAYVFMVYFGVRGCTIKSSARIQKTWIENMKLHTFLLHYWVRFQSLAHLMTTMHTIIHTLFHVSTSMPGKGIQYVTPLEIGIWITTTSLAPEQLVSGTLRFTEFVNCGFATSVFTIWMNQNPGPLSLLNLANYSPLELYLCRFLEQFIFESWPYPKGLANNGFWSSVSYRLLR